MDNENTAPSNAQAAYDALDLSLDTQAKPPALPAPGTTTTPQAQADKLAPVPLSEKVAGMIATAAAGGAEFFPSLATTLPDDKCQKIGDAVAPVLVKWKLDRWFNGDGEGLPELGALWVLGTIGWGVFKGIQADMAQADAPAPSAPAAPVTPIPVTPAVSTAGLKAPNQ